MLPHKVVSSVLQAGSSFGSPPQAPGFNFADIKSTLITNPGKESLGLYHFMASGLGDLEN
jgi:hypothetical protein